MLKPSPSIVFANVVFALLIILVSGGLLIAYFNVNVHSFSYNIIVFSVLIFILSSLVFAIRTNNSRKVNIAILIASTGLTIYGVEGFLELKALRAVDPYRNREVVDSFLKFRENRQLVGAPSPLALAKDGGLETSEGVLFPLSGISKSLTLFGCNEDGFWASYLSDEYGFNNPEGLHRTGQIDIVLVGDSFTHGACVNQGDDIASHIRMDSNISTLNLGVRATGPLFYFATILEYARPIQPKIVLWNHFDNDLNDLIYEKKIGRLNRYLDKGELQELREKQSLIDQALIISQKESRKLELSRNTSSHWASKITQRMLLSVIKLYRVRKLLHLTETPQTTDDFFKIIGAARDEVTNWGGQFFFVMLPGKQTYIGRYKSTTLEIRKTIKKRVAAMGIPIIDLHEHFLDRQNPLTLFPAEGSHYTASGYQFVASIVIKRLVQDGVLKR